MNNSTEFSDENKPLNPEALKNINVEAGDGKLNANGEIRDHNEGLISQPTEFEAVDFTSYKSLSANAKYFVRLQDVSNIVLNGYNVPFCSQDFRPINVPLSRQRTPVLPYDYYITSQGITGGGATFFSSWTNYAEDTYLEDFQISNEKFTVKMDEKTKAKLMTLVSIWSNEYLDKGVRDSRARPSAVLGDWAYALPPTFSMTERTIRTDVIATWMYGAYTATSPAETITIINNSDLREFMNQDGGNYWPVEANTLCLALGKSTATALTKLKLLGHDVIIDFDSSMNSTRGTATMHNGVPAWSVSANTVTACDVDIARILNNTYSSVDLQWALFANVLPLSDSSTGAALSSNKYDLLIYENTIAEQFINFYATHRDYGNKLPITTANLPAFVQAWRVYKTVFTQRTLVEIGYLGKLTAISTFGKTLMANNYYDLISCCFSMKGTTSTNSHIIWIPYELWIMNGADLKLDEEDYVDGDPNILTNTNYCVPRSQVLLTPSQWSQTNTLNTQADYYAPNSSNSSNAVNYNGNPHTYSSCYPSTIPSYKSTTDTATLPWNKDQTIDFTFVRSGKNANAIYRKKMVFKSAVKN